MSEPVERLAVALWATDIESRAARVASGALRWDHEDMHAYRETFRAKAARLLPVVEREKAAAWDEGLRAAHKALGGQFIWFAPDNPYEEDA